MASILYFLGFIFLFIGVDIAFYFPETPLLSNLGLIGLISLCACCVSILAARNFQLSQKALS